MRFYKKLAFLGIILCLLFAAFYIKANLEIQKNKSQVPQETKTTLEPTSAPNQSQIQPSQKDIEYLEQYKKSQQSEQPFTQSTINDYTTKQIIYSNYSKAKTIKSNELVAEFKTLPTTIQFLADLAALDAKKRDQVDAYNRNVVSQQYKAKEEEYVQNRTKFMADGMASFKIQYCGNTTIVPSFYKDYCLTFN